MLGTLLTTADANVQSWPLILELLLKQALCPGELSQQLHKALNKVVVKGKIDAYCMKMEALTSSLLATVKATLSPYTHS